LIDGCDLVFLAKSKDGDYHQEMNSVVFLEWFENQLMPALKNPGLVVLDNASYHNVKTYMYTISYPASLKDLIFLR
jgi:transposase